MTLQVINLFKFILYTFLMHNISTCILLDQDIVTFKHRDRVNAAIMYMHILNVNIVYDFVFFQNHNKCHLQYVTDLIFFSRHDGNYVLF